MNQKVVIWKEKNSLMLWQELPYFPVLIFYPNLEVK